MRRAWALVVVLALVGCNGGTVDRHALTNDAATLDSINCEAWLLSGAAARKRVTKQYTREQAHALRVQAANFADALARRPTAPGLEQRVRKKAREASELASELNRLQTHPTDRDGARSLSARFKQAGNCS